MVLHGLRVGDRVSIAAPGTAEVGLVVDATVEDDEVAILRPVDRDARAAARSLPVGVPVGVTVPLGAAARIGSTTVERITSPGGFVVLRNYPFLEHVNRRSSYRVEVAVAVDIAYDDGLGAVVLHGRTLNLSVGGMAALVRHPVPTGIPLEVTLHLPSGDLCLTGSVVGTDAPPGADVRMAFEPGKHEAALGSFLNKVETGRPRTRPA